MRYLQLYKHTKRKLWHPEEEVIDASEVLQGKRKRKILSSHENNSSTHMFSKTQK